MYKSQKIKEFLFGQILPNAVVISYALLYVMF